MKKVLIAALLASSSAVMATVAQAAPNMEKYNKSCSVCHAAGVAGAPKIGDTEAWEPRLAKGMDALLASIKNGLNAMPPQGMCFDCTDEEYIELIKYMSTGEQ